MKTITILFISCIFFQSCYSYKVFDKTAKEVHVDELYKFDLTNRKEFHVKIDSIGQNYLHAKKSNKDIKIPYSEIKTIETAQKSPGKTVGLISIIIAGAAVIAGIIYAFSSWNPDF